MVYFVDAWRQRVLGEEGLSYEAKEVDVELLRLKLVSVDRQSRSPLYECA